MNAIEKCDALLGALADWECRGTAARWDAAHGWHHPVETFNDQVVFIPRWLQ